MTDKEKMALIYRIVSGYNIIGPYIIDTPTDSLINESIAIYYDQLQKNRFEGLISLKDTEDILIQRGLWVEDNNLKLTSLDTSLDDTKLELYNNFGMPNSFLSKIRHRIDLIKKKKIELLNIKHSLDIFSIEALAEHAAETYIFSKLVLNNNYELIKVDSAVLDRIIQRYKQSWPENSELRLVARSEPWRSMWTSNPNCFRVLGDEQKVLILFSKMYDTVYENAEKPHDDIINDDDMLDGWFIHMKREQDKQRGESAKSKITGKHPGSKELFVVTQNPKDITDINNMNDERAKIVMAERNALIKRDGVARDKDVTTIVFGK